MPRPGFDYVPGQNPPPTEDPYDLGVNLPTGTVDYGMPGVGEGGNMTLRELLPPELINQYDWSEFQDMLGAGFDTSLLDITKQQGRQDVMSGISQNQFQFMQNPNQSDISAVGGFSGSGGGGRGLLNYQTAQKGMFGDVYESMLGARKADISALESLKDRAFDFFYNVQGDLDPATNTGNGTGDPAPVGGGYGGGGCFLKNTMILAEDGTEIPIQDIKLGMKVYAYDEKLDMLKIGKVIETFFHPKENTYLIINNTLFITPNHPVLINKEWVEAGNLKKGDMLTNRDNELVEIESIKSVDEVVDVYNFEVEKYHTYIAEGIIVHNKVTQGDGDVPGTGPSTDDDPYYYYDDGDI